MKLLWRDQRGFLLLYKRLERGRFPRPEARARDGLWMAELMAFLEGIDLSRARRLPEVAASRVARLIRSHCALTLLSTGLHADSLILRAFFCRPRQPEVAP